jgi:ATP-dependent RNA helicase RhlB
MGDLPQVKRLKIINDVKAGKINILVATDVAARGLDIDNLSMVINYDLPIEAENYVHRIGRTARAGKTGKAITLASEQDVYELPAIERYIGKKIPSEIAMQELYEEDLSAGQIIRTDFYEERGHITSHTGVKTSGKRYETGERSKTGERSGKRKHETAVNDEHDKKHEKDFSQLPMEDRMALYKKKYAGGLKHGNKEHGRKNVKRHHALKHFTEKHEKQTPQEQIVPAKKSILSKLTGLFKKK